MTADFGWLVEAEAELDAAAADEEAIGEPYAYAEWAREHGKRMAGALRAILDLGWYGPLDDPAPQAYINGWNDALRAVRAIVSGDAL